jgi:hypothetical protein
MGKNVLNPREVMVWHSKMGDSVRGNALLGCLADDGDVSGSRVIRTAVPE